MAGIKASDSAPWSGRPMSDFCLSADECAGLPNTLLSRLEARLLLEAALEARNPRLLLKKPVVGGLPVDFYALHQAVLRLGGYRKVRRRQARPSLPFREAARPPTHRAYKRAARTRAAAAAPAAAAPGAPLCHLFFSSQTPAPRFLRVQVEAENLWDKAIEILGPTDGLSLSTKAQVRAGVMYLQPHAAAAACQALYNLATADLDACAASWLAGL